MIEKMTSVQVVGEIVGMNWDYNETSTLFIKPIDRPYQFPYISCLLDSLVVDDVLMCELTDGGVVAVVDGWIAVDGDISSLDDCGLISYTRPN